MKRSFVIVCAGLAGLWASGGCGSAAPTVSVRGAEVRASGPDGALLSITLDAENPSTERYPLKQIDYRVELDGRTVFAGRRAPEATLAPGGSRTLVLPVPVAAADGQADRGGSTYRVTGSIEYTTPGAIAELFYDAGLVRPRAAFAGSGTLAPRP